MTRETVVDEATGGLEALGTLTCLQGHRDLLKTDERFLDEPKYTESLDSTKLCIAVDNGQIRWRRPTHSGICTSHR